MSTNRVSLLLPVASDLNLKNGILLSDGRSQLISWVQAGGRSEDKRKHN